MIVLSVQEELYLNLISKVEGSLKVWAYNSNENVCKKMNLLNVIDTPLTNNYNEREKRE